MTSFAAAKILAAESSLAIVARCTRLTSTGRKVHRSFWCRDLSVASRAGLDRMTAIARKSLRAAMFCMRKSSCVFRKCTSRPRSSLLVTGRTGIDIVPFGDLRFCDRSVCPVTLKTSRVRVGPCRNRKTRASLRWRMTGRTISVRHVTGVIKTCVERPKWRKTLHVSRFRIGVTDRTEGYVLLCEVLCMTA